MLLAVIKKFHHALENRVVRVRASLHGCSKRAERVKRTRSHFILRYYVRFIRGRARFISRESHSSLATFARTFYQIIPGVIPRRLKLNYQCMRSNVPDGRRRRVSLKGN